MKTKIQEDLYANLEMQIAMALDYNEWLSQEKTRTDELLDAHRSSLRGLNTLLIQSQPEEAKEAERGCEETQEGGDECAYLSECPLVPSKEEVVSRFCALASQVGGSFEFKNILPHDCFCCEARHSDKGFQFDEEIIEYIEKVVMASLGVTYNDGL